MELCKCTEAVAEVFMDRTFWCVTGCYDQVGSNSFLEVVPGIVHFSGLQVNVPSVQVIQIRNVAGIGTRVHVLPPETAYFQVNPVGGKGQSMFMVWTQP